MRGRVLHVLLSVLLILSAHAAAAAESDPDYIGNIVFPREAKTASEIPPAMFPHWVHRINFKCYACHDAIFEMKAGADTITMDAIRAGKFCGVCHNGKIAFAVGFDTCDRCHSQ